MRIKYKILCAILATEWLIINSLQRANAEITIWYEKIIGLALFLCPLLLLFRELSMDEKVKPIFRNICGFLFWLFLGCFILGVIAEMVSAVYIQQILLR